MSLEDRLQKLIRAAWEVIERDFDEAAYMDWREEASACLSEMLGSDHIYSRQFEETANKPVTLNLLAAGGILEAAKEDRKGLRTTSGRQPTN